MILRSFHIRQRLFHAVLSGAQKYLNHVLVDVHFDVLNVKYFLLVLAEIGQQSFKFFDFEIPISSREVLQHFHTDRYPFLHSDHAEKKKKNQWNAFRDALKNGEFKSKIIFDTILSKTEYECKVTSTIIIIIVNDE